LIHQYEIELSHYGSIFESLNLAGRKNLPCTDMAYYYLPQHLHMCQVRLEEGDSMTAKRTSLIVGIIGGVIGLAMLLYSQFTGAVTILVVIPAFLGWYKLEQKS